MVQILHHELNYPKNVIGIERSVHFGRERKRADILVYNNPG